MSLLRRRRSLISSAFACAAAPMQRDECHYRPALTVSQFLSPTGFAERKIHLCLDVVHLCRQIHNQYAMQHLPRAVRRSKSPQLSVEVSPLYFKDENCPPQPHCNAPSPRKAALLSGVASEAHGVKTRGGPAHAVVSPRRTRKSREAFFSGAQARGRPPGDGVFAGTDGEESAEERDGWRSASPWETTEATPHVHLEQASADRMQSTTLGHQNEESLAGDEGGNRSATAACDPSTSHRITGPVGLPDEVRPRPTESLQSERVDQIWRTAQMLQLLMEQVTSLSGKVGAFSQRVTASVDELHLQVQLLQTRVSILESRLGSGVEAFSPGPGTGVNPQSSRKNLESTHLQGGPGIPCASDHSRFSGGSSSLVGHRPAGGVAVSSGMGSVEDRSSSVAVSAALGTCPAKNGSLISQSREVSGPDSRVLAGQTYAAGARDEGREVAALQSDRASPCTRMGDGSAEDHRQERTVSRVEAFSPGERSPRDSVPTENNARGKEEESSAWGFAVQTPSCDVQFPFSPHTRPSFPTASAFAAVRMEKGFADGSASLDPLDVEMQRNVLRITEKIESLQAVLRRSRNSGPASRPRSARPEPTNASARVLSQGQAEAVSALPSDFHPSTSSIHARASLATGGGAGEAASFSVSSQHRGPASGVKEVERSFAALSGPPETSPRVSPTVAVRRGSTEAPSFSADSPSGSGTRCDSLGLPSFPPPAGNAEERGIDCVSVSRVGSAVSQPPGEIYSGTREGEEKECKIRRGFSPTSDLSEPSDRRQQSQQTPFFGISCSSDGSRSELLGSSTGSLSKASPDHPKASATPEKFDFLSLSKQWLPCAGKDVEGFVAAAAASAWGSSAHENI
ncbi:hypothetical protein TGGT1_313790 [Toxoplasma gondii GT1]|uniref:Centrosomal protein of 44 kDa n=2 Tax=Toxoplasma gondii TaxID=5811 RepID=S7UUI8_TOXGG|nr:hypothetical protein TGGT1_313790 [Toxoplasma gondii GT1]KAF4639521.1 hypothetical protein TGRH88_052930 [Toxoplasma gondii]